MLLIKYDGITNINDAIKTWNVSYVGIVGCAYTGFYFIQDDIVRYGSKLLPNNQDVVYKSSEVAKWNCLDIQSLPKEIFNEVRKRSTIPDVGGSLVSQFIFGQQPEGHDFWNSINHNKFYKFYDNKIINNHETKLQDQNSSVIRGEKPKRNIICGKKSRTSITSGSVEYGRISRGK